jgi:hypothetical protein
MDEHSYDKVANIASRHKFRKYKNVATTIIYYLYIEMYQTDSIKIMVHVMHREKYKIAHGINIDV